MDMRITIGLGMIILSVLLFIVSLIYHAVKVNKVTDEVVADYIK